MNDSSSHETGSDPSTDFLVDLLRNEISDIEVTAGTHRSDDPSGGNLRLSQVLKLVMEETSVISDVTAEVDFILAQTPPLTPIQQATILRGADHGVQLAAKRRLDPQDAVQELQDIVAALRAQGIPEEVVADFGAFVELVRSNGRALFEDYDPNTVARWVIDLAAPSATLLSVMAPRREEKSQDPSTLLVPVGSAVNSWDDFAHDVLALIDAHKSGTSPTFE